MSISNKINNFFENKKFKFVSEIIILRTDGISLYSNFSNTEKETLAGALTCSLWQAAKALSEQVLVKKGDYRLAFDTTTSGIYILPIKLANKEYYICTFWKDQKVPAQLKNEVRKIKDELESFLEGNNIVQEENREGFLFQNITDAEMDDLFSMKRV